MSVEMVNSIEAARAYEANITALQVSKQMYMSDLRVLA
jgi:flagellar basal body rod protein FlgC